MAFIREGCFADVASNSILFGVEADFDTAIFGCFGVRGGGGRSHELVDARFAYDVAAGDSEHGFQTVGEAFLAGGTNTGWVCICFVRRVSRRRFGGAKGYRYESFERKRVR